jgi:hypothetical protein
MTVITSSDNPRFRECLALGESGRHRRQAGLALLDGLHLIKSYRQRIRPPPDNPEPCVLLKSAQCTFRGGSTVPTPLIASGSAYAT